MKENNRELQYFKIEHAYGGSQEWFSDSMSDIKASKSELS